MGEVKKIPYGDNLMEASYSGLKGWYEKSAFKPGAKGFFERAGKAVVVIPAHILASIAQTIVMAVYDFVLAMIFGMAALCTGFKKRSINGQFLGHLGSLGSLPEKALKHLAAAFCPPGAYKSDNIRKAQYEHRFENHWKKGMPELAWDAYKNGYVPFSKDFAPAYTHSAQRGKEIEQSGYVASAKKITRAEDKKYGYYEDRHEKAINKDKAIGKVPFGSNLMTVSYSTLKNWFEKSNHKTGKKAFFEKVVKSIVLMPAHIIVGTLQSLVMAIYDLALGIIFSLAALFTGFKRYSFTRQALGHLGSLIQLPGFAFKNFAAAICPSLAYKSENVRHLQYQFQFSKLWLKEEPQREWEVFRSRYYLGSNPAKARVEVITNVINQSSVSGRIMEDHLKNRPVDFFKDILNALLSDPKATQAIRQILSPFHLQSVRSLTNQNIQSMADRLEVEIPSSVNWDNGAALFFNIAIAYKQKFPQQYHQMLRPLLLSLPQFGQRFVDVVDQGFIPQPAPGDGHGRGSGSQQHGRGGSGRGGGHPQQSANRGRGGHGFSSRGRGVGNYSHQQHVPQSSQTYGQYQHQPYEQQQPYEQYQHQPYQQYQQQPYGANFGRVDDSIPTYPPSYMSNSVDDGDDDIFTLRPQGGGAAYNTDAQGYYGSPHTTTSTSSHYPSYPYHRQ